MLVGFFCVKVGTTLSEVFSNLITQSSDFTQQLWAAVQCQRMLTSLHSEDY